MKYVVYRFISHRGEKSKEYKRTKSCYYWGDRGSAYAYAKKTAEDLVERLNRENKGFYTYGVEIA